MNKGGEKTICDRVVSFNIVYILLKSGDSYFFFFLDRQCHKKCDWKKNADPELMSSLFSWHLIYIY